MVISLHQHVTEAAIIDITARLRAKGLPVHPMESGVDKPTFLGLEIDCIKCTIRIKPSRLWKLRFALDELLDRGACSSRTMESVLGHCTWISLLRREALGIFHQCYAFICHDRSRLRTLWPGVRKELAFSQPAPAPLHRHRRRLARHHLRERRFSVWVRYLLQAFILLHGRFSRTPFGALKVSVR